MNMRENKYNKIAKTRAKEYLRNKKGYKTKVEKKAFRIAEKFRIKEWKNSLSDLDPMEAKAQLKAFKVYMARLRLIRNLILAGLALAAVIIFLIVLL